MTEQQPLPRVARRETVVRHYGSHYLNRDFDIHGDTLAAANDARAGSHELKLRIEALLADFEARHGLNPGEARVLLLDTGVRPQVFHSLSTPAANGASKAAGA